VEKTNADKSTRNTCERIRVLTYHQKSQNLTTATAIRIQKSTWQQWMLLFRSFIFCSNTEKQHGSSR